jgi:hypothetical protein
VAHSGLAEGLARLVADGLGPRERVRALRDLGEALWRQHRDVSGLASRGAELLAEAVSRLPIRDPDTLAARYGGDVERTAGQLVDEAARLAGWVWTATAVVPAPARAVRVITVLVHSAVEIRLIAELYAIYGTGTGTTPRDPSWLRMVVSAWAAGGPVAAAPPAVPGTRDIVVKLRHANAAMAGQDSRLARLRHRGKEEAEAVRRLGWRFRRRMRPHPSTWASPAQEPGVANALQAAGDLLRSRPGPLPEGRGGPPAGHLSQAWTYHLRARVATESAGRDGDPAVLARLQAALAHQEAHLRLLGTKLRCPRPLAPAPGPEPAAHQTDPLRSAHTDASLADDAIDLAEEAGSRPRRLAGWPVRLRNGLVYAVLALALAGPVGMLTAGGMGGMAVPVRIMVWVLSVAGLSMLAYGLGLWLTGRLFRPWLGGRVARSPIVGFAIAVTISALTLAAATVMAGPV